MNTINQFDLFPTVETERRIIKTYSQSAAMLINQINTELNKHGLSISDQPLILEPGLEWNFQVLVIQGFHSKTFGWKEKICQGEDTKFSSLGELDRNAGNLIRCYGEASHSNQYIDDMFMPFSETLKRKNPDFKSLIEAEEKDLTTIYALDKKEKYKLVSYYSLPAKEKNSKAARNAYKCCYYHEIDFAWSYLIYQCLSIMATEIEKSITVGDLINDFFVKTA